MKAFDFIAIVFANGLLSNAFALPDVQDISVRDAIPDFLDVNAPVGAVSDLFKRKGGGGKGGSSGSSGGSSSGGSSGSGSSGSGGSSSGSRPASSGGGGTTSTGSRGTSVSPSYGGGRYYGGGSTTAYGAGARSPRGISPFLIAPLVIFPGIWLAAAYAYPYSHPYTFHNSTATNSSNPNGVNQTKPITCLCQEYNPCGCDDNSNSTYLDSIIGNGSYPALNKSLVTVSDVNGTNTIVINGTLPNDTTTSSGSSGSSSGSTGAAASVRIIEWSGYWVMAATVVFAVWGC